MLEWIVSAGALLAVLIALRYILRGKISPRLQYALWLLALVRLLVPFGFGSSGLSVLNILPEAAGETVWTAVLSAGVPADAYTLADGAAAPSAPPPEGSLTDGTPNTVLNAVTDVKATVTDWGKIALAVWIAGMAAMAAVFLAGNLRFAARLRKTRRVLPTEAGGLPVYVTEAAETPCLFGLFRPAVYLPPEVAGDAVMLRHALAHENAHFRHGDPVWSVLRGVCLVLHWYNPLVWWAAVLSRRDAELCCDAAAVKALGEAERAAYGRTLIAMTCQRRPELLLAATTMTDGGGGLRERIALLVKRPKTAVYTCVAVVLIAAVAAGCTFTGAKTEETTPSSAESAAPATETEIQTDAGTDGLIVDALNSDGAYAEAAEAALAARLLADPSGTLAAIGARSEGIRNWVCWSLAVYLKDTADTGSILSAEGLSEDGQAARDVLAGYLSGDEAAPKSWRQVYLDLWDETLAAQAEAGELCGVSLMDFDFDGVPELAAWQPGSGTADTAVLYDNDGAQTYHNLGSTFSAQLVTGRLSAQGGAAGDLPATFWLVRARDTGAYFWCLHSEETADGDIRGSYMLMDAENGEIASYDAQAGAAAAWETFDARFEVTDPDYSAFTLSAGAGDGLTREDFNALLNAWRPVTG